MSDSILSVCRHMTLSLAIFSLLLLALSCGGNEPRLDTPATDISPIAAHGPLDLPQLTGNPLDALPGLPAGDPLAEPNRNLSFTNIVSYNGNGIFDSSPGNLFPNNSIVLPSSLGGIAWARYAFNTQGYQPERLSVDLVCNPGSVAYVGYSDYQTGHWHWKQPSTGPVSYDLPAGLYLNSNNQLFVIVLTAGGSAATVNSLSARFDNDVNYNHSISGRILDEHGAPVASQSIFMMFNPDNIQLVTDVDGSYIVGLPTAGMYSLEPQSMNTVFNPPVHVIDLNGQQTDVDFTATRIDIRGRIANADGIGLAGVSVTLDPGALMTTVSGANGEYEFQGVADGAYTVAPLLASYSFSPSSAAANVSGADVENVDFEFTGGQPTYGIFGNIHESNLDPVPGIFVTLTPGYRLAITDASGNYGFTGLAPATYDLKPVLGKWSFAPGLKQVNISGASENGADFTATPPPPTFTVAGKILWEDGAQSYGIPHVTAEIRVASQGPQPVLYTGLSDSLGNYEIFGVPAGGYTMNVKGYGYDSSMLQSLTVIDQNVSLNLESSLIDGPTWDNFAASYVSNACSSCHRPDSQTAVDPYLRTYTEVKNVGTACNARIQAGTMPPGNPSLPINKRYFQLWRLANYPEN